jgi:hypothetical protein
MYLVLYDALEATLVGNKRQIFPFIGGSLHQTISNIQGVYFNHLGNKSTATSPPLTVTFC